MPRGSIDLPHSACETSAGLRERAGRARRLARAILDQQAIAGLTALAQELEARAAALEPLQISHSGAVAVQQTDPDASQG
jgi:hypothetical protein